MRIAVGVIVSGVVLSVTTGMGQLMGPAAATVPLPPVWHSVQTAGGQSLDGAQAVALASGDVPVIVGTYVGTAYFPTGPDSDDSISLGGSGGRSVFVATLDQEGEYFTWAQRAFGASSDVSDVVVMGADTPSLTDDTIIVMGAIAGVGTMYFPTGTGDDSVSLSSAGPNQNMFVAAARVGGGFAWAQLVASSSGNSDYVVPTQMALDSAGAPVLTGAIEGYANGTIDFPGAGRTIAVPSSGTFVAALSNDDSTFDWVQRISGESGTFVNGPALAVRGIDTAGPHDDYLLVTGGIEGGTAYFPTGRGSPDDSIAVTADGVRSGYVAAMNADDSYFSWVTRMGGAGAASPRSLAVAPDGTTYLVGSFQGTVNFPLSRDDSVTLAKDGLTQGFVASITGDDSYFSWAAAVSGTRGVTALDIAITPDGTPIAMGSFRGELSLPSAEGAIYIPAWQGEDATYVAAMNAGRPTFSWAQSAGGVADDDRDGVSGRALALLPGNQGLVVGQLKGNAAFPSAQGDIAIRSRGSQDVFAAVMGLTPITPPVPVPPLPASAPGDVGVAAGDARVLVSWSSPRSTGSFPVSYYLTTSSPGGHSCLVAAPALTCVVTGLTNGTAYTFTVKALTGAGWSPASDPSNAVTPTATPRPTITITGAREGKRIAVTGATTGMDLGGLVTPWASRGARSAAPGKSVEVSIDGGFTWSRVASARMTWSIYFTTGGGIRSNTVVFASR